MFNSGFQSGIYDLRPIKAGGRKLSLCGEYKSTKHTVCHMNPRVLYFRDRRKILLTPAVDVLSTCKPRLVRTQRTMKTRIINSSLILILAAWGIIFFTGCASMETNKTTSLLSQAGFRMHTPQTAQEKELYAAFPSNKLERGTVKGKAFYVYKDEKAGVEYVGGEREHQRYHQLCMQQHVAEAPEEQMNDFFTRSWSRQLGHDYSG
jgi:hypothetical protein